MTTVFEKHATADVTVVLRSDGSVWAVLSGDARARSQLDEHALFGIRLADTAPDAMAVAFALDDCAREIRSRAQRRLVGAARGEP